jgi:hypothetical protein
MANSVSAQSPERRSIIAVATIDLGPSSLSIYKLGGEPKPWALIVDEMLAYRHPFAPVIVNGPCAMTYELAGTVPL